MADGLFVDKQETTITETITQATQENIVSSEEKVVKDEIKTEEKVTTQEMEF